MKSRVHWTQTEKHSVPVFWISPLTARTVLLPFCSVHRVPDALDEPWVADHSTGVAAEFAGLAAAEFAEEDKAAMTTAMVESVRFAVLVFIWNHLGFLEGLCTGWFLADV
ncbi:hypothetical protein [Streptomyces sp. 3214.6]|uniref:hypothetical protein n=1 Tax=Streptomyces sp. 3214.6 TaxID=1882757 RepID=UPI00117D9058|nr:hypothetical protein [Streptomyces sp. 3214.6]